VRATTRTTLKMDLIAILASPFLTPWVLFSICHVVAIL
jgi:hypothetical protein